MNVDNTKNCSVCERYIDFAGSKYYNGQSEVLCLNCVEVVRGDRDDLSYISTSEVILDNSGKEAGT